MAGAAIGVDAVPDKLNPVVKPLMEAVKAQRNAQLQAMATKRLAQLLDTCLGRGTPAPAEKVVRNLINFAAADRRTTPRRRPPPGMRQTWRAQEPTERHHLRTKSPLAHCTSNY